MKWGDRLRAGRDGRPPHVRRRESRLVRRYPVADGTPPSQALVEAAELAGCEPDSADVLLADVIRGTALDRLFAPDGDAFVTVPVWGLLFAVGRDEVLVLERL